MSNRPTGEKLQCKYILSDEDLLKYGRQSAQASSKKRRIEESMKAFQAQQKAEIQMEDGIIAKISEAVNNGYEYREIQCRIVYDFDSKTKDWVREDTGEVVKTDVISERELQEEMSL